MTDQTIENTIKEFREKFLPSSLKWKDAVHCTCCSTEQEYKDIESFLRTHLLEAEERGVQEGQAKMDNSGRLLFEQGKAQARTEALEEVEKELGGMKKVQLDKNDPDNYGAIYAIAGFNDALDKVVSILRQKIKGQ